jgi:hypothetical protein
MGDPACGPGYRKYRLSGAPDHARHLGQGGDGEVPAQHAPADVRVERRGLDAEALGGLGGGEELGPALPLAVRSEY